MQWPLRRPHLQLSLRHSCLQQCRRRPHLTMSLRHSRRQQRQRRRHLLALPPRFRCLRHSLHLVVLLPRTWISHLPMSRMSPLLHCICLRWHMHRRQRHSTELSQTLIRLRRPGTNTPRLRQNLQLSDVQVPLRPVVSARLCSSRLLRVQAQANTRRSRRQECLLSGLSRTGGPLLQARPARPLHLVLRLGGLLFVFQLRLPLPVQVHLVLQLHLPLPGQVRPVRPPRPGLRAGRPH